MTKSIAVQKYYYCLAITANHRFLVTTAVSGTLLTQTRCKYTADQTRHKDTALHSLAAYSISIHILHTLIRWSTEGENVGGVPLTAEMMGGLLLRLLRNPPAMMQLLLTLLHKVSILWLIWQPPGQL